MTEKKINGPIDFKIGLVIETTAKTQGAQFYCHSFKVYTGKTRVENQYSLENEVSPNVYNLVNDISCGEKATNLRFDPLPAEGEVAILDMRIHTRYWHQVNLSEAIKHIKPINSIESVKLINEKIIIKSIGNDPYIELSNNLQSYTDVTTKDYLLFLLEYSLYALILIKLLFFILGFVLKNGQSTVAFCQSLKTLLDQKIARIFAATHNLLAQPLKLSGLLVLTALLIYLFSAYVFTNHLVKNITTRYFFTLGFILLQFFLLLSAYVILLRLFNRSRILTILIGFSLIFVTLLIAADVSLFSLNGMHIKHGFGILTDGGVSQFFNNLKFTGLSKQELSLYVIAIFFSVALSLITVWVLEYRLNRYKLDFSVYQSIFWGMLGLLLIFGLQSISAPYFNAKQVSIYEQNHPLGISFFNKKDFLTSYDIQARSYDGQDTLTQTTGSLSKTDINNVYLFIFESLREDVVGMKVTPHLEVFRNNSWHFDKSVASGNATHYGWYSIINSRQPFYWERYKQLESKKGSIPLQLFKKHGFQINIYTAKDLSYLQSDQIMFGSDLSLVDYISPHPEMSPPDHDRRVINDLLKDIKDKHHQGKNLNIVFLDSSHYPYRWNADEIDEIKPYQGTPAEGTDLSAAVRMIRVDKSMIFNRYKNSIKYMDHLFGEMVDAIQTNGLSDQSLIVAVGDHGQQFMEHGYMLHGFTLFNEDIDVPMYFQAPNIEAKLDNRVASQVDIMPTIFDYLDINIDSVKGIDGTSMFSESPENYKLSSVAGEQNTPSSFVLSSNKWKLFFRTVKNNPSNFKKLYVTHVSDQNDIPHIPGDGLEQDYREFINHHFPDFLINNPILNQ